MSKKFLAPIVPPRLASDPNDAVVGAIYYNTEINALKFFNGDNWIMVGTGAATGGSFSLEVLNSAPSSPQQGRIYFDIQERTAKIYNGNIWYDVAGPKEILDHMHYAEEGLVREVQYGEYVIDNLVVLNAGTSTSTQFTGDIINGGNA